MDKPKRKAKRTIRWHMLLLALMMTGTTLVMGGSIILSGIVMRSNSQMRQALSDVQATGEAQPTQTPLKVVMVITATPVPVTPTLISLPTQALAAPTSTPKPVWFIDCSRDADLLKALETGGDIQHPCIHVIHLKQTIHIYHDTTLSGEAYHKPLFTGDHELSMLFYVHRGAHLTLNQVALHDSQWRGIQVEEGARLTVDGVYFFGHGIKSQASDDVDSEQYYSSAIWNAGQTTIRSSRFEQNASPGGGAALNNRITGVMVIENSTFSSNTATQSRNFAGGALLNYGMLSVKDSSFDNNSAYAADGGALASVDGEVSIVNTNFFANRAGRGGALYNASGSHMTLEDGRFSYNSANEGSAFYNIGVLNLFDSYIANQDNACATDGTLYDPSGVCGSGEAR